MIENGDEALIEAVSLALQPETIEDPPADTVPTDDDGAADASEGVEVPTELDSTDEAASTPELVNIAGRDFDPEAVEALIGLYDWAENLSPAEAERVRLALSNDYDLSPRGQAPAPVAPSPSAPEPEPAPDPFANIDPDLVDPGVLQVLRTQQAQLESYRLTAEAASRQAELAARTVAANRFQNAVEASYERKASQYGLTTEQVAEIAYSGRDLVEPFAAKYDDPNSLYDAVIEHALWTNPEYRQIVINAQSAAAAEAAVEQQAATSAKIQEKTQKAAATATSNGSIPRVDPAPRNMTRSQRNAAMAEEIAKSFS